MLYIASVTIHVLAAMLWVGGMGFFALVVVPASRRALEQDQARATLRAIGARLASVSWWLLGTLAVTGLVNLYLRGVLPRLGDPDFWRAPFGRTLAMKLAFVGAMVVVSSLHARDARRPATGRPSPLGRVTLVLSLVVVVLAVMLVRGA